MPLKTTSQSFCCSGEYSDSCQGPRLVKRFLPLRCPSPAPRQLAAQGSAPSALPPAMAFPGPLEPTGSPLPSSGLEGGQCCPNTPPPDGWQAMQSASSYPSAGKGQPRRSLPPPCPTSQAISFLTLTDHNRLKASPYIWKLFHLFTLEI